VVALPLRSLRSRLRLCAPPPTHLLLLLLFCPQLPVNYGKKRTLAPLPAAAKITHLQRPQTPARGHNLDNTMVHLDATFVSDWLTRANDSIAELQVRPPAR